MQVLPLTSGTTCGPECSERQHVFGRPYPHDFVTIWSLYREKNAMAMHSKNLFK